MQDLLSKTARRLRTKPRDDYLDATIAAGLFLYVLLINRAIPGYMHPYVGMGSWIGGFAESFANGDIFTLHAANVGYPSHPPAVGALSAVLPMSLLLRLGMHPVDAYPIVIGIWLAVADIFAFLFARKLGVERRAAILAAGAWMTIPFIWTHFGYGLMVAGFALQPAFLYAAIQLHDPNVPKAHSAALLCALTLADVFIDGYNYIFFAISFAIVWSAFLLRSKAHARRCLYFVTPVGAVAFAGSYLLYTAYIQTDSFTPSDLNFFRGWAVDVTYFIQPSRGVLALPDMLGISALRTDADQFGDSSVYNSTFLLPLMAVASWAFWKAPASSMKYAFAAIALTGIYFSLGPTLKVASRHPTDDPARGMSQEYGVMPTGSAWISTHLPGFKNMRASYRWSILGQTGCWALMLLYLSRPRSAQGARPQARTAQVIPAFLILINTPHLPQIVETGISNRHQLLEMEADNRFLENIISHDERVAFLPWGNDFFPMYIASRFNFTTYNIGGDKNLELAIKTWPKSLLQSGTNKFDDGFSERVAILLQAGDVDVVVLPYFDMLWGGHVWPIAHNNDEVLAQHLSYLRSRPFLEVIEFQNMAVVRLAGPGTPEFEKATSIMCLPDQCIEQRNFEKGSYLSQVGIEQNGSLITDGRRGFLLFGPYKSMREGKYCLRINADVTQAAGAYLDIATDKGKTIVAKYPLINTSESRHPAEFYFSLDEPAEHVEVRIFVEPGSKLSFHSFLLKPSCAELE